MAWLVGRFEMNNYLLISSGMIGPKRAIDTDKYRVICASILGGPFGTTSPLSLNPQTGKPYGPTFPSFTTK